MRKQHYMTSRERDKLEAYWQAGKRVAWIAQEMGFCRQTIYNELKRGQYEHERNGFLQLRYSADKGQQRHEYMQTGKGRPLKIGHERAYAAFLEEMVVEHRYSPGAALAAARGEGFAVSICVSTFYSYIEKGVFLHITNKHLWEKSKRKKQGYKPVRRVAHPLLPSISQRPEHINQREQYGHWEMDLVVGKTGTTACLLTLHERKSRQELIIKMPNRRAATVRAVFDRMERSMGKHAFREKFKSITTDNGPEFLEYEKLSKSIYGGTRFQIWYCHSYAAWEKGGNENHNRMIRRWFPKGTDFTKVTKKQVAGIQYWMNSYPRKILGWQTPMAA